MYRRLILTGMMLVIIAMLSGCSQKDVPVSSTLQNESLALSTDSVSAGERPQAPITAAGSTYAYGLIQVYDANHGDYDWLAVFYLPYNPGSATFQGRAPWGWQTYSGSWAQVYEAVWTSRGFRVKILIGSKVTLACGTSAGNYRLLY